MSYKVNYHTLAIMSDGHIGNVNQGLGHVFTDNDITDIPDILNKFLLAKKQIGVIDKIEDVKGYCI